MERIVQTVSAYDSVDRAVIIKVYHRVSGCYAIYVNGDFYSTVEMQNEIEEEIGHIFRMCGFRTCFDFDKHESEVTQ
jgi:hypothetical protein